MGGGEEREMRGRGKERKVKGERKGRERRRKRDTLAWNRPGPEV